MFWKRDKQSPDSIDTNYLEYQTLSTNNTQPEIDNKLARLMELINYAIEEWAIEFHMEMLPKKVIFEQAFDALSAIEKEINNIP